MLSEDGKQVSIAKWLPHSPNKVFHALSTPEALEQWLSPSDEIEVSIVEFNFTIGGSYHYEFKFPDGRKLAYHGEFEEISPPNRIVYSWTWLPPDQDAGVPTRVTLKLVGVRDGTTLSVSHEQISSFDMQMRHRQGWDGALKNLEQLFLLEILRV